MKGHSIGYHNKDFAFSANIQVNVPNSGFSFQIGKTGDPFYPVVSFSGHSGYLFDQSGSFFGGYRRGETFTISGNYFFGDTTLVGKVTTDENATGRFSYYHNDNLIANNINGPTGFFDTVLFEDYGGLNSLTFTPILETGSQNALLDTTGTYLLSSEGYFLSSND
tara:strand:+ start:1294 stop:1788 length:495 start_codon:yes stop_codon:yes gene_type:complete